MLLMFSTFSVLFYIDGSTGYRKKNEVYYLNKAFQQANDEFSKMNTGGTLTPAEWKKHASEQAVKFPDDASVIPVTLKLPMPWPPILHDFEKMKPLQWNILWREYTKDRGMNASAPEEPYDAQKIREQWVVFYICVGLATVALFFLLRTLGRSITVDETGLKNQQGKVVSYKDMKVMDLRKWETKGLAFIEFDGEAGKGRLRVDGLTYGGFKKEDGAPAEKLIQLVRSRFSGEIIEYATSPTAETPEEPANSP